MLYARMRTLLNECLPPNLESASEFSTSKKIRHSQRTFSGSAVLATTEANFAEVGAGETVIATSGAIAGPASSAPECGLATSGKGIEPVRKSPTL